MSKIIIEFIDTDTGVQVSHNFEKDFCMEDLTPAESMALMTLDYVRKLYELDGDK